MNISKHRSTGYSYFNIVEGRDPLLPGHFDGLKANTFEEVCLERLTYIIDELIKETTKIREEAALRIAKMNKEIVETV